MALHGVNIKKNFRILNLKGLPFQNMEVLIVILENTIL
jgi:hypothetical protein